MSQTSLLESIHLAFSGWGISWKGIINNKKGEWFLILQIILITAHLLPAWPNLNNSNSLFLLLMTISGSSIALAGIILASKALLNLGTNLCPLAEPKPNSQLIMTGSYHFCRHPLYQALLIGSLGVTLAKESLLHLFLLFLLAYLLRSKARREERSLVRLHPEYITYRTVTPAIIPGLPPLDWRS